MTKQTSDTELKDCPFCGGYAHVHTYEKFVMDQTDTFTDLNCVECRIGITIQAHSKQQSEFDAIQKWNKRSSH